MQKHEKPKKEIKKEKKEEEKKEEEEKEEERVEEPKLLDDPIKVKDILFMYILSLEGKAWAYLDLVVHPETQKHKKDVGEARLAIDTIDAIYKIIEDHLSPEEKKDIQVRLTNLRLNFVK
ncbi:unnamed protein product [marine sediment metagenome]|uniref:DUF1844 domain-containing protein n=1 Tax=marine sediment metagenome TaxID=412755 RepID=X1B816_9ZZZZ